MHNDELLVPDENDDPSEISEFGRLADFISGRVPENELRNFGAANTHPSSTLYVKFIDINTNLFPTVKTLSTDR